MKTINTIKNSWTWNHKHLLFTLSLMVALVTPLIQEQIPKSYTTYAAEPIEVPAYVTELELRAVHKYRENYSYDMQKAMTQVLIEEQEKLNEIAERLPQADFDHLQNIIDSMQ